MRPRCASSVWRVFRELSNRVRLAASGINTSNAFHAMFSHAIEDVLCGIWIGLDVSNHTAVYRMLMSPNVLHLDDLNRISGMIAPRKPLLTSAKIRPLSDQS